MKTPANIPSLPTLFQHIATAFDGRNRTFKIALALSFILHAMLFFPTQLFRSPRRPSLNENLVEVNLVNNTPQPRTRQKKRPQTTHKPKLKVKRKVKIKKKSPPKKKSKTVTKESSLARRRSRPKKNTPAKNNQLDEIKNRLARQQQEEELDAIRQRLHNSLSPAARARQASLIQTYNQTLTAWIMRNWHLPEYLLNSGLEATISLTITASGALIKQQEEQLSGNSIFDHAMRQAVTNANPFPPFPAELSIPQEEFVITFNPNNISKEN